MAYAVRDVADLAPASALMAREGIFTTTNLYSPADIAAVNAAINTPLKSREDLPRAYVMSEEMLQLDIFHLLMNQRMRDLLLSVMPDPVLYHFHIYEIAARQEVSHIFSEKPGGWHRDGDAPFFAGDPTHVSVFVYLRDVGEEDGPFEFVKQSPEAGLCPDSLAVTMTGETGTSFAWHRSHFHRAAPNRGARRRRLMKVSVQRNAFPSPQLKRPHFQALLAAIEPGDVVMDTLLGRFQGEPAPLLAPSRAVSVEAVGGLRPILLPDAAIRELQATIVAGAATRAAEYD